MSKYIDRITSAAEQFILSRVKNNSLFAEYYNRSTNRAPWKRQASTFKKQEIKDWTMAVTTATDPENPRRANLMRFYRSIKLDLHLASVIDTRILRVQRSSFKIVNEKGEENDQLKELLQRPWFDDLVSLIVGKTFQGTTLIELFDTDELGELTAVSEIPQSNFIPQKGIIIKEEYDDNGTSYREGFYKDYYVQIGGDWELGMLNQLAMVVIAKKLGLGSWMSYIEKFGVPPLFAITDRMDPDRREELFSMLENFRMNHFAVLQGNEKIEVPNNYNVDAYNSFKSLTDVCNTEMSKRILGGTATVDEKSFVGSAQVQERVAQDRHEADKLLFLYYFNTHIRQRLAKISSVYKDFATHKLIWDNQETLNIEKYIEAVEKLSTSYEFDFDEIRKRTGLPITGVKVAANPTPPAPDPTTQKKKPDAKLNALGLRYAPMAFANPFAATWDAATERLADQILKGEVKASDLDKDQVLKSYAALNKEAAEAWGKGYYDDKIPRKLRENLMHFSGAKSHRLITELQNISSLNLSKQEFIEKAKKLINLHNDTYLETEKKFAANSASSARNYESYMGDVDIYPCLKCRTMGDELVRETHAINDGVIKYVKDWNEIPPFDPGCRCWLEQTNEPPTTDRPLQNIDKKWANNPYTSGNIFTPEHNYFESIPKLTRTEVKKNAEIMKQFIPYNRSIDVGKNKIYVNDFADLSDMDENIEAAKKLSAELNKDIYIRPHTNNVKDFKNPEFGIGTASDKGDLKTYQLMANNKPVTLEHFINNSISSANEQGVKNLVLDISNHTDEIEVALKRRLCGSLNKGINRNIQNVFVIRDNKVSKITRKQINSRKFNDFFDKLK